MSNITMRPLRVIAASPPASSSTSTRHADFAALMSRDGKMPGYREGRPPDALDALSDNDASRRQEGQTLGERTGSAGHCAAGAPLRREQQLLALAHLIARDVVEFASNPVISRTGQWEVNLRIDPRLLPGTRLRLLLSPAALSLQFDVESIEVRELLLQNFGMLERMLSDLLAAQGALRNIELSVY